MEFLWRERGGKEKKEGKGPYSDGVGQGQDDGEEQKSN